MVAGGRLVVVILTGTTTVMDRLAVAFWLGLLESVASRVKLNVPALDGVPSISATSAALVDRVKPSGSDPLLTVNVYRGSPPAAGIPTGGGNNTPVSVE